MHEKNLPPDEHPQSTEDDNDSPLEVPSDTEYRADLPGGVVLFSDGGFFIAYDAKRSGHAVQGDTPGRALTTLEEVLRHEAETENQTGQTADQTDIGQET